MMKRYDFQSDGTMVKDRRRSPVITPRREEALPNQPVHYDDTRRPKVGTKNVLPRPSLDSLRRRTATGKKAR